MSSEMLRDIQNAINEILEQAEASMPLSPPPLPGRKNREFDWAAEQPSSMGPDPGSSTHANLPPSTSSESWPNPKEFAAQLRRDILGENFERQNAMLDWAAEHPTPPGMESIPLAEHVPSKVSESGPSQSPPPLLGQKNEDLDWAAEQPSSMGPDPDTRDYYYHLTAPQSGGGFEGAKAWEQYIAAPEQEAEERLQKFSESLEPESAELDVPQEAMDAFSDSLEELDEGVQDLSDSLKRLIQDGLDPFIAAARAAFQDNPSLEQEYVSLFRALEQGKTDFGGQDVPLLHLAKDDFRKGRISTPEELYAYDVLGQRQGVAGDRSFEPGRTFADIGIDVNDRRDLVEGLQDSMDRIRRGEPEAHETDEERLYREGRIKSAADLHLVRSRVEHGFTYESAYGGDQVVEAEVVRGPKPPVRRTPRPRTSGLGRALSPVFPGVGGMLEGAEMAMSASAIGATGMAATGIVAAIMAGVQAIDAAGTKTIQTGKNVLSPVVGKDLAAMGQQASQIGFDIIKPKMSGPFGTVEAMSKIPSAILEWTNALLESKKAIAAFSGEMQIMLGESWVREINRAARSAGRTGESALALSRSYQDFLDRMQPYKDVAFNKAADLLIPAIEKLANAAEILAKIVGLDQEKGTAGKARALLFMKFAHMLGARTEAVEEIIDLLQEDLRRKKDTETTTAPLAIERLHESLVSMTVNSNRPGRNP